MNKIKNIGIVGLGLIGGSLAKSAALREHYVIRGVDASSEVIDTAVSEGVIKEKLDEKTIKDCHLIIVALWPQDTVNWILDHAPCFSPGTIVVDCCGVKGSVCSPVAGVHKDWYFIGGHPMAGREYFGYSASTDCLFEKAPMILTPDEETPEEVQAIVSDFFLDIGFARVKLSTPEEHDRVIAYTSQLAHVVSSAYVKGDMALKHQGFSAGSLKDLTRVARLNEHMWTELFLNNREALADEIDELVLRLQEYGEAVKSGDRDNLTRLLREGRERKEQMDHEKNHS